MFKLRFVSLTASIWQDPGRQAG